MEKKEPGSYTEYQALKQEEWHGSFRYDFSLPIVIEVKLVEVYDTFALAQIIYKKYPWMELEVVDEVKLK